MKTLCVLLAMLASMNHFFLWSPLFPRIFYFLRKHSYLWEPARTKTAKHRCTVISQYLVRFRCSWRSSVLKAEQSGRSCAKLMATGNNLWQQHHRYSLNHVEPFYLNVPLTLFNEIFIISAQIGSQLLIVHTFLTGGRYTLMQLFYNQKQK